MTYISHKRKILDVLAKNENGFLSPEEIAVKAYPGTCAESTKGKKLMVDTVRRNIGHVIELAAQNDLIIIPKKEATKNDKNKYFKVIGYKIVTDSDKQWINQAIDSKEQKATVYIESFNLFQDRLVEKELLEANNLKKLN